MNSILDYFPQSSPREKQVKALLFIEKAIQKGFKDIVIEAPTGIGKSSIGVTVCHYAAANLKLTPPANKGGYYFVTQKLLQDQLAEDAKSYLKKTPPCLSIKSASSYACPTSQNCGVGLTVPPPKRCAPLFCAYLTAKSAWRKSLCCITNYPYIFTEKTFTDAAVTRQVAVFDECHTLEDQILRFVDLGMCQNLLEEYAPELALEGVPKFKNSDAMVDWISTVYLPECRRCLENYIRVEKLDEKIASKVSKLQTHISKFENGIESYSPKKWVFWTEINSKNNIDYILRPLHAADHFKTLGLPLGDIRVYMSAFPGTRDVFCRSLGIKTESTAWASFGSTFPVENRKVMVMPFVSMSKSNQKDSIVPMCRMLEKIASRHATSKGIIHCHSYALGKLFYTYLMTTKHGNRVSFPTSEQRESAYKAHVEDSRHSILITPSMTEGFDFKDDRARWQVIPKVPYPYLGDKQVLKRMEQDPEWYMVEVLKKFIQTCGRVVRSDTDTGVTYVLDADFVSFYNRTEELFPKWFKKSLIWVRAS